MSRRIEAFHLQQMHELSQAVRQEASRRSLLEFTKRSHPKFLADPFHVELCKELEQFLEDVVAGKSPRLIINAPPRHGKSEIISRRFPAWSLGKYPWLEFIATSYSASLASRMNRDVQRIMDSEPYLSTFPRVRLSGANQRNSGSDAAVRNQELFEVVGSTGSYRSAGVGGGITGMGMHIGIIDDPLKDQQEANSDTVKKAIQDWFDSTFYTRLHPGGGILICMTRWVSDDLVGALIEAMKNNDENAEYYKVLTYKAIATDNEKFRDEGEVLAPSRYDINALNRIRTAIGSRKWSALYQQSPTDEGGGVLKSADLKRYKVLPRLIKRRIYADTAQKTAEVNDYSVFQCWGLGDDGRIYLIDQLRGKWEGHQLEKKAIDFWQKHQPYVSNVSCQLTAMKIEDKSSGTGLIQFISKKGGIPVKAVQRTKDKYTRAQDGEPYIEAGLVCIPEEADFCLELCEEIDKFSRDDSHKHDDQVDPMLDAIEDLLAKGKSLYDVL